MAAPTAGNPEAEERTFPEGVALAVAAVFGAVLVLAGAVLVWNMVAGGDDQVEVASPTSGDTPEPATGGSETSEAVPGDAPAGDDAELGAGSDEDGSPDEAAPEVELTPCPTDIDPVICDAAAFVQEARGRPFQEFPTVEIMENAAFDQALLADFEQYRAEIDADGRLLAALGLLDPGISLADAYEDALSLGVVGFYDPTDGRLVVRGTELNLYAQLVLVHELVHAFDDQWFDLNRDDFADLDAEYGFTAVAEGNASRIDEAWRNQLSRSDQALLMEQELGALDVEDIQAYFALPAILRDLQLSPYIDGAVYVEHLAASGELMVDDALLHPPSTSEEILHPGRSRSDDPELDVAPPPAGGTVVDEGRLGELLISFWLGTEVGSGWGGDHYVAWVEGDQTCVVIDIATDTPADLDQVVNAGRRWADEGGDSRSVEMLDDVGGHQVVRLSGCA